MEQEQTPKQVQPEDTDTIQIEERDAKREFNTGLPYIPGPLLSHGGGTHTFTWLQVPWGVSLCGGARRLKPSTQTHGLTVSTGT